MESVGPADLQSWHTNHIGPNRLVAGLTGDVSAISLAEHLSTLLEGWPEVPDPEPIAAPVFNVPARTTIYIHDRPGLPQTELRFAGPGLRRLHPDYAPLLLWSNIVGIGGATNRMVVRLRTEHGTYVKEVVTGEDGRSNPSLSELFGVSCECVELDVLNILSSEGEQISEPERPLPFGHIS